ncbi:P-loop containing nucleoside triphosphate hydrolase protein [Coprinopsis marcescibilis]|uniref:P-loop containing nucleoside triphosphate hydrolase protein n=1 Tax=Coprinopsis marcescibilis TaxID=230819 RepID=A0A5C3LAI1_COPMA|nr:P-loop containing nucleoside triphosphate hydrolase protein [Coprinopsis marcescibilis]
MATPQALFMVAQQMLTVLTPQNASNATQVQPPAFGTEGFSAGSLFVSLVSFSTAKEWMKLAVLGAIFETIRRIFLYVYKKIYDYFFLTVVLEDGEKVYAWMTLWLLQHPAWTQSRDIQIADRPTSLKVEPTPEEEAEGDVTKINLKTQTFMYIPSLYTQCTFWYKRHWVRIYRGAIESKSPFDGRVETLIICIWAWKHNVIHDMLLEAKMAYKAAKENKISIHVANTYNGWEEQSTQLKRPLASIVLDPGVRELLLNDARDFLLSKHWYLSRGIPFRRGYLLYGPPGTGKTSVIQGIAGELGLDVYIVSLSRVGMDDAGLNELIANLPERCIALMEDIDVAFSRTLNRELEGQDGPGKEKQHPSGLSKPTSKVTLSGLLNALDGIGAQEGRLLFATTNKYTSLDAALSRPGRMDIHVEFKLASKYQARQLYRCFYHPDIEAKDQPRGQDPKNVHVGSTGPVEEKSSLLQGDTPSNTPHQRRGPQLSIQQVEAWAKQFFDAIPDREFSMAALQGYLMAYKTRPCEAVAEAGEWVNKQRLAAARIESERTFVKVEAVD